MVDLRLENWQYFPHIMMMDITHSTNCFNWKLLKINSITYFRIVFPVAFTFSPNEDEAFFHWVLQTLNKRFDAIAKRLYGKGLGLLLQPLVVLTDYTNASRNAVRNLFPEA
jgi:hypothetical protein